MSLRILSTIAKHWATCRRFQGARDRALYLYGRMLRRLHWGLPGRYATVRVHLRGHQSPFYLRLSSTDWLVLEEIFHHGEYVFVERHVKKAAVIVDLGANAGFSVRYWHALYPDARIIAVEPEPANCQACEKNIAAAGLTSKVELVRAAIGLRAGRADLLDAGGEWGYRVRNGGSGRGIAVDVCPLDQVLDEHAPGQTVDLLKCDIEGGERELFAECGRWIDRVKAMVIELHPPYGFRELKEDLSRCGAKFGVVEVSSRKACPIVFLKRLERVVDARPAARATALSESDLPLKIWLPQL
jgi:FkbM family methyltransferase